MSLPLYKGRYLICVYSKDEVLLDVFDTPREAARYLNTRGAHYTSQSLSSRLYHILHGDCNSNLIKLVDVFERNDDIFAEEDKLFLEFMQKVEDARFTTEKLAIQLGCSTKTANSYMKYFNERERSN